MAWDCGTGNGQAALGLADHFERVLATDVSAEPTDLAGDSFALVAVAQAVHWFDRPRFFATVSRVLQPGGLLALWCYSLLEVAPAFDAAVRELHDVTLAPDWTAPRALVMEGYRSIELPFPEVTLPPFAIEQSMPLAGGVGYLSTWSAIQQRRRRTGADPLAALVPRLIEPWGDLVVHRVVRWPLHLRVGRKPS